MAAALCPPGSPRAAKATDDGSRLVLENGFPTNHTMPQPPEVIKSYRQKTNKKCEKNSVNFADRAAVCSRSAYYIALFCLKN
jgi:hypothetical protein